VDRRWEQSRGSVRQASDMYFFFWWEWLSFRQPSRHHIPYGILTNSECIILIGGKMTAVEDIIQFSKQLSLVQVRHTWYHAVFACDIPGDICCVWDQAFRRLSGIRERWSHDLRARLVNVPRLADRVRDLFSGFCIENRTLYIPGLAPAPYKYKCQSTLQVAGHCHTSSKLQSLFR